MERTESFRYTWTCTEPSDEIEVCADYKNAVAESNEGNNCKTVTLGNGGNGDKPDLVITDIWHEGSKIYYKIKNIGTEKAGSSRTSLTVDGAFVKDDSVRSLGPGAEKTESFRYTWTCTEPSDEIEVCADYKNAVAESNEGNNCRTETWENGGNGDKPDLVITDVWHEGSKIYYKIKNIGTEKAGSSRTSLWVDGAFVKDDSVRSLGAGEERTESFRYTWTCTGASDEIEVCVDYKNAVAESNEGNNCKTETLENGDNGDKPDLVITDIWHEGSKIYYKIKNIGTEKAGSSRTSLTVDGAFVKDDSVRSLGPGAEKTESFRYTWTCTEPSDEIEVCADYKNAVAESNEGNNCRTETWECDGGIEYWGVIAGVSDYKYLGDLNYSDDDARDIYNRLLTYNNWKASNIKLLIDSNAEKADIHDAIDWMKTKADADDICLFFFSGHGFGDTDLAPFDEVDGDDEYICPHNSLLFSNANDIRDDELDDWMTPIQAKKVVLLDTCFCGGFTKTPEYTAKTKRGIPYREPTEEMLGDGFAKDIDKPSYVVLMACDDDELSWEFGALRNGVFTYYVVEGLGGPANTDGDNDISAEETYDYAGPNVVAYTGGLQNPQIYDGVTGELPVVKYGTSQNAYISDSEKKR